MFAVGMQCGGSACMHQCVLPIYQCCPSTGMHSLAIIIVVLRSVCVMFISLCVLLQHCASHVIGGVSAYVCSGCYGLHICMHGMFFVLLNMHADILGIYMFADRHICVFCA